MLTRQLVLWRYYATQKKTLEVNPRHPLVKELKRRVDDAQDDQTTKDLATVLYETAVLRSGYALPDTADFAGRVERMLRLSMNVGLDEKVTIYDIISRKIKLAFSIWQKQT